MTCHVTFSGKKPLFEELVAVFSNVILLKRVLDAGQLFPSSHVWNNHPSFTEEFYQVKGRFLQNSTFDH